MGIREILQFFIKYKYQAIFPIAVAEGPIISIIAGFLISRGHLSFLPVLLIVFFGDFLSDLFFYLIGRGGREAIRYIRFLHLHEDKLIKLESQYETHPWKTMIVAKASYGLGIAFMVASGLAKLSWQKFVGYAGSLNFVRSIILIGIGYYFGKTILSTWSAYAEFYVVAVLVLISILYILFRKRKVR